MSRPAGQRPDAAAPPRARPAAGNRLRSSQTGDGDFAEEHTKATYADEVPDGPEHATDPDSPTGLAGADPGEI